MQFGEANAGYMIGSITNKKNIRKRMFDMNEDGHIRGFSDWYRKEMEYA